MSAEHSPLGGRIAGEVSPATEAATESEVAPVETAPAAEASDEKQTEAAEQSSETQGSAEQKEEANS